MVNYSVPAEGWNQCCGNVHDTYIMEYEFALIGVMGINRSKCLSLWKPNLNKGLPVSAVKGIVHPKMILHSFTTHPYAD